MYCKNEMVIIDKTKTIWEEEENTTQKKREKQR